MKYLLTFIVLILVAGCERASSSVDAGGQPEKVRVGYFANLTHAQAVVGVHNGDFAKAFAPAKLETKVFNAGPSVIEAMFAGELDIAYIGPGPAINGFVVSNGDGLRVIAGAAANGVAIVARPGSGIKTMADLKGRKIATPQHGNTQDIAARFYLIDTLKQPDADNILPVANAEQLSLMSQGQIDAAWSPEPWASRLIADGNATLVAEEKQIWPGQQFAIGLVIVTPEFLKAHPDLVEKFLAAHVALTHRLTAAEPQVLKDLGDGIFALTNKRLPDEVFKQAVARILFTTDPLPDTIVTQAKWAIALKFLRREPDVSKMIDLTILNRLGSRP
jgi:NitT/TauT family transport system substrate-binding protein